MAENTDSSAAGEQAAIGRIPPAVRQAQQRAARAAAGVLMRGASKRNPKTLPAAPAGSAGA